MDAYFFILIGITTSYSTAKILYKSITLSIEKQFNLIGEIVDYKSESTGKGTTHYPIIKYKDPIDHKKKKFQSMFGRPTKRALKQKIKFTYIRNYDNEIVCEELLIFSRIIMPSLFLAVGIVLIILGVIKLDFF